MEANNESLIFLFFTVNHYQIQISWRKDKGGDSSGFNAKLYVTLHGEKGSTEEIALNE